MQDAKDVGELIRRWVQALDARSMAEWRTMVRQEGLSIHQMILLMRLFGGGSCGVPDLGRGLGVSSAAASQMVDRMVQAGLVDREESAEDRRVRRVQLSSRGRQLMERAARRRYQWVEALVEELGAEERAAAARVIPALIEAERHLPDAIPARPPRRTGRATE